MFNSLQKYIDKQIDKWVDIRNDASTTDSKKSLVDYAEGRVAAYLEIRIKIKRTQIELSKRSRK